MNRQDDLIKHLIIINAIFFIAPQFLNLDWIQNYFALWFIDNPNFGFWQFFTHMFMHGSTMHLLFNMYALWAFGTPLLQMWGNQKFAFFYFTAGLGAAFIYTGVNYFEYRQVYNQLIGLGWDAQGISTLLDTGQYNTAMIGSLSSADLSNFYSIYHTPAVGASGAIYGVLVAFGFAFPNAKLAMIFFPVPIAAKYFIPLIILGDLFFGISGANTGTAHFAHVGGALVGYLLMKYWQQNQFQRWD